MATYSSIPDGKIPWTEEPGGLYSMGLQQIGQLKWFSTLPDTANQSIAVQVFLEV